jgi:uncharacterized protein HemX
MSVELVISIVTSIAALIGGGAGIIYWRENKRLKVKEVEKAAIENELQQAEAWKQLFESERERAANKSALLKELYAERDGMKEDINALKMQVEKLQWYHCTVNGCLKRRPPHIFDDDGNESEA